MTTDVQNINREAKTILMEILADYLPGENTFAQKLDLLYIVL